jgi:hypothetical protein
VALVANGGHKANLWIIATLIIGYYMMFVLINRVRDYVRPGTSSRPSTPGCARQVCDPPAV